MAATDPDGRATPDALYSVAEAAALLGVSERTLRRRVQSGQIDALRDGHAWRIPASALPATGGRVPATPPAAPAAMARPSPATPAADLAPLAELIADLTAEIADLTGRLAVAEERLRALGPGPTDAPVARPEPPGRAGPRGARSLVGRYLAWVLDRYGEAFGLFPILLAFAVFTFVAALGGTYAVATVVALARGAGGLASRTRLGDAAAVATIVGTLVAVVGAVIALWRWWHGRHRRPL